MEVLERLGLPTRPLGRRTRRTVRSVAWVQRKRFSAKKRAKVFRVMASYIRKSKRVRIVLARMRDEISRVRRTDVRVAFCRSTLRDLQSGSDIGQAIAAWVPHNEALVIKAGQTWGTNEGLASGFEEAAELAEAQNRAVSEAVTKLAYPAVLTFVFVAVISYIAFYIVPTLTEYSEPERWSGRTAQLYAFSVFFRAYWDTLLLAVVGLICLVLWTLPAYTGAGRTSLDRFPPYNLYRSFMGTSFLMALSSMIRAGEKYSSALRKARIGATPYLGSWIDLIQSRLRAGGSPVEAIDCAFLEMESRIALRMAGEEDDLADTLHQIASNQLEGVQNRVNFVAVLITIVSVGLIIGGIYISYTALYGTLTSGGTAGGI